MQFSGNRYTAPELEKHNIIVKRLRQSGRPYGLGHSFCPRPSRKSGEF